MTHRPSSPLLAVDVRPPLYEELGGLQVPVADRVVEHRPAVLVLRLDVRPLVQQEPHQPAVGDLDRVVEGGTLPVVPHVHVLAPPEDAALEAPLGGLVVPVPGSLQ